MRTAAVPLLLACSVIFCSCDVLSDNSTPVLFQNVRAAFFRVQTPQTVVFRSRVEWEDFWNTHVGVFTASGEKPPPLAVDFDRRMLVGVFWGNGPYAGCTDLVEAITEIRKNSYEIVVHVGKLPYLGACRAYVFPYQIVEVERFKLPVRFTGHVPK